MGACSVLPCSARPAVLVCPAPAGRVQPDLCWGTRGHRLGRGGASGQDAHIQIQVSRRCGCVAFLVSAVAVCSAAPRAGRARSWSCEHAEGAGLGRLFVCAPPLLLCSCSARRASPHGAPALLPPPLRGAAHIAASPFFPSPLTVLPTTAPSPPLQLPLQGRWIPTRGGVRPHLPQVAGAPWAAGSTGAAAGAAAGGTPCQQLGGCMCACVHAVWPSLHPSLLTNILMSFGLPHSPLQVNDDLVTCLAVSAPLPLEKLAVRWGTHGVGAGWRGGDLHAEQHMQGLPRLLLVVARCPHTGRRHRRSLPASATSALAHPPPRPPSHAAALQFLEDIATEFDVEFDRDSV